MFFKKKKSILNIVLDAYNSLFEMWKKESFNDGSIDEIAYVKDNIKIIFQEDLREHITNLFVIDSKKQIGKVYYRELMLNKEMVGIDRIKNSLASLKNNSEKQEVEIYIEFLKLNKIL
jgi:hypothetical protein